MGPIFCCRKLIILFWDLIIQLQLTLGPIKNSWSNFVRTIDIRWRCRTYSLFTCFWNDPMAGTNFEKRTFCIRNFVIQNVLFFGRGDVSKRLFFYNAPGDDGFRATMQYNDSFVIYGLYHCSIFANKYINMVTSSWISLRRWSFSGCGEQRPEDRRGMGNLV